MAIANQEMIRDNNRRQVLEYLVNHPPDRKSTRLNSSHTDSSRMPSSA